MSTGLELTLDRNSFGSLNSRAACGILRCVEHNQTDKEEALSLSDTSGYDQIATISGLKVFKLKSGGKKRSLLASISPEHSRIRRVSNGMKVDGRLEQETGRASLQVKLNKEADCQAEFLCQVNGVDIEGRQTVKTSHILQLPMKDKDQTDNSDLNSRLIMQVLDLVQEMDAKIAVMNNAVGKLDAEINHLRESNERSREAMRNDLNGKIDRLEDKTDANSKRLEDKTENVSQNLDAKTDRLEDKLETTRSRLEDSIRSLTKNARGEVRVESSSCQSELSEQFERRVGTGISSLESNILLVKDHLAELETNINASVAGNFAMLTKQIQAVEKQDESVTSKTTNAPSGSSCEKIDDFAREISEGLSSLSSNVNESFSHLSSAIRSSNKESRQSMTGQTLQDSLTPGTDLQYTIANLLTPKTCYKGMSAYVPAACNDYVAIDPSPSNGLSVPVLCDMRTDGGGWVVIQRRVFGDVDFYKGWADYKRGFGALYGDFWLGNDLIHNLTSSGKYELRIDMKYGAKSGFAHYGSFSIKNEAGKYALSVSNFSGTAGDAITAAHNGAKFSTYDRDNDTWNHNCAESYTGAWWYKACHHSNLNGRWGAVANKGPRWSTFSSTNPVTLSEMKIRQVGGKTIGK
ncbi:fibrinogen-like protein 1 [Elysia marginata]|uniref:Fibrinogen-like protein 1 n=1 Tax=Elysia marginata TaxID=1093978 RepID=A0AAV4FUL0_9GAST|nr:fibrinogen-like protein 1 [Elysia marginata]